MKILFLPTFLFFTQVAHAGIYHKDLWKNNAVVVCFAEAQKIRIWDRYEVDVKNWSSGNRKKLKMWITSEYTAERTGIHFVGWKNCAEEPNADVILFIEDNFTFFSPGGLAGAIGPHGNQSSFPSSQNWINFTGINQYVALHEFGHVAGLYHEHIHFEAPDKVACKDEGSSLFYEEAGYEPYDPQSVMSYCNRDKVKTLSPREVELLKRLYP